MKIAIACDHGGFPIKAIIANVVTKLGHEVVDLGAYTNDPADDYPDFARYVGQAIQHKQAERGILICGSGVGACVAANKIKGVRASVALSVARDYHALSLLASLECHTFLERLVLPLTAFAWSVMYAISVTNNDNRPPAFANGQFFLIRRSAYETVGGHESVRDQITEDVELARLLKHQGFRVRLVLGMQFVSTRMHATLPQMLRGWGRIYSGTSRRSPWRIVWAALFLILSCFSGYVALAWGLVVAGRDGWSAASPWLIASLIHLGQMMGTLADVYAESGNRRRYALLFPLGGTILLGIMGFAIRWCITGRIEWRGTVFQQPDRSPPLAR